MEKIEAQKIVRKTFDFRSWTPRTQKAQGYKVLLINDHYSEEHGDFEKSKFLQRLKVPRAFLIQNKKDLEAWLTCYCPDWIEQREDGVNPDPFDQCPLGLGTSPDYKFWEDPYENSEDAVTGFSIIGQDPYDGGGGHWDIFARPCPVTPRHGFVDSTSISNAYDLAELWTEAIEADPQAEMLLMMPINAKCSAIYSTGALFYGDSNDGATSGINSQSLYFEENEEAIPESLLMEAGVKLAEGDAPYVEIVFDQKNNAHIVQLRSGPAILRAKDYIPYPVNVKKVVVPEGVGLEWEERAASMREEALNHELVVHHPGGNLGSHFAVHCRLNKVPCITSFEPKVGDYLDPVEMSSEDEINVEAVLTGIHTGTELKCDFKDGINLMLAGLHGFGFNPESTYERDYLMGVGAAMCLRLGSAACLGEYRHHQKGRNRMARRQIFHKAWDDFFTHQKNMCIAYRSFKDTKWKSGYGGRKWAECAKNNIHLWLEVLEFTKSPSMEQAKNIGTAFNRAVNVAHNGGWLFNKFTENSVLDQAASGNPRFYTSAIPSLHEAMSTRIHSLGWKKMRRPRVFRIKEDNGVRDVIHNYESHSRGELVSERKPRKVRKVQLGMIQVALNNAQEFSVHIQYKKPKTKSYLSANVDIAPSAYELIGNLDHTTYSLARTSRKYLVCAYKDGYICDKQSGHPLFPMPSKIQEFFNIKDIITGQVN